jgi:hypothetical protein
MPALSIGPQRALAPVNSRIAPILIGAPAAAEVAGAVDVAGGAVEDAGGLGAADVEGAADVAGAADEDAGGGAGVVDGDELQPANIREPIIIIASTATRYFFIAFLPFYFEY